MTSNFDKDHKNYLRPSEKKATNFITKENLGLMQNDRMLLYLLIGCLILGFSLEWLHMTMKCMAPRGTYDH